jgi:hypothetical protein
MADTETGAVITFDDGSTKNLRSTVEDIEGAIGGITMPIVVPMIKVVDEDGREVWINVNHIRELRD